MRLAEIDTSAKLCYVENGVAYFSNDPDQWGDDWDDAPYDCNAGEPYDHRGFPVYKIAFRGDFSEYSQTGGRWLSVEQINKGAAPWLSPGYSEHGIYVPAGVTVSEFVSLIHSAGGEIYMRIE